MIHNFALRLKELREEEGLSQGQLGKLVGIKQANISRWESGLIEPTAENIVLLAKFFKVSTDYLLGLEE